MHAIISLPLFLAAALTGCVALDDDDGGGDLDPWAWGGYSGGALSINLWQAGEAPPAGSW